MHYIRFLKPARISPKDGNITAKITITTDLGESFLALDIGIVADIRDQNDTAVYLTKNQHRFTWRGSAGARALEIVLPKPRHVRTEQILQMVVRPEDERYACESFTSILEDAADSRKEDEEEEWGKKGKVVAMGSMPIDLSGKSNLPMDMAERVFYCEDHEVGKDAIHIWEETGESIARHIWDAGLVLSAYLSMVLKDKLPPFQRSGAAPRLQQLESLLLKRDLIVLELGAGCGIVGLTLASHRKQSTNVQLTDLPEATEILEKNVSQQQNAKSTSKVKHQVLDWSEEELPEDVATTKWDLVLVADCTYNPDVVPDLVKTLKRITGEKSKEALICLAMKVRHESEMVFFELMRDTGYTIVERGKIRLPLLGDDEQVIEIFVFRTSLVKTN